MCNLGDNIKFDETIINFMDLFRIFLLSQTNMTVCYFQRQKKNDDLLEQ